MAKNRLLLLSSVAFGVSFGLSLLISRDIKTALLTGLITVPATYSGVVAINRKQRTQQKRTLTAIQAQIHRLKQWKTKLNQSCLAVIAEKQRAEVDLNFLQTELSQLYAQLVEQKSHKQQLSQDLITFSEQKCQLEAGLHNLQTQIQNCEQRRVKLHQSIQSIKAEKQNAETKFNFTPPLEKQLQIQQHQKEELAQDLVALNHQKTKLEENSSNLKTQIQELEKRKIELDQSLSDITQETHITEVYLNSLQAQLSQLKGQVLEQQSIKENLEQELTTLLEKSQIKSERKQTELTEQWNEFMIRLPLYEFQVLKAIVGQVNTRAKIKKIAEENITMPELLVDFINQRALNTIGDLIIEPGNESFPPKILEEYLTNVNKVIEIKEMN